MRSYQQIYQSLPFPSLIVKPEDRGFVIVDLNNEFIKTTGGEKEDLIHRKIADGLQANLGGWGIHVQEIERSVAKCFASGKALKMEPLKQEIKDADSGFPEEQTWQVEIIPIPGEADGEILVIFRNVTVTEAIEKPPYHNVSRFKALVQEGTDLIAILDSEGIYKWVSEASSKVLGLRPEHFINKCAFDFIHPEDRNKIIAVFENLTSKDPVQIDIFRFKNNIGEWRWIECKITDFRDNPHVNGIVANSRDVTDEATFRNAIEERKRHGAFAGEFTMRRKGGSKFPVELSSALFEDMEGKLRTSVTIRDITEKKLDQEILKASQRKYEVMFRHNPLPNWIYDRSTLEILDVNEAAIIHYGYSKEEFLQMRITDLRPVEEMPKLFTALEKWQEAEGVELFGKTIHLKKDGTPIKVEVSGSHLRYDGRDCSLVVCNDTTEKEKILQKLEDKSAKLLTAQRIAKLGYWERHFKDNRILWTDEVYKIWGRDKKNFEPTPERISETIHPEDLEKFRKGLDLAERERKEVDLDFRILLEDGSLKWINGKGKLAVDENGKASHYEGTYQDITENRLSTQKLRLSEARHRGILNSQTNYLVRTDLEGNLTYGNQKFLNDFEWNYQGNIVGKHPFASVHSEHHERVKKCFKTCIKFPNQVFQVEMDKLRENKEVVHTLWDFVCLTDSTGQPVEVQCVGIDISDRIKTEKLLQQSNERYELVSRATLDAIYDWDCVSEEIKWNEGYYKIFGDTGKDSAPATMETWVNSIHPEDRGIVKAMYAALDGTQCNWETTYRIRRQNGEYAQVLGRGFIVRDENQKAVRMVGAIRDITENKKLEELLEQASNLAKIGSFEVNLQEDTVYWSPVTKEIHEVEQEFIPTLEKAVAFAKEGENRDKARKAFLTAVQDNIPYDVEIQIVTSNGNERWVRIIGRPDFINGKCVRISGSFQDIDSIKKVQLEALRASEEKQVILESIGDAFFAVDNDWIITYFNKHAEALLECNKDEVLGTNLWDSFSDAVDTDFYSFYQIAMSEKKVQNFEEYFERVNRWFDVSAYPSENGLSVYFRDITERKNSHLELLKLNKELKVYTKELVDANKGLEQFSYIVSHNLRSPVANILGLANIIEDESYPPEVREKILKELFNNVGRLDNVIRDLNSILQLKKEIREWKENVELEDLVESIKDSISHLIHEKQLQIITDFEEVPVIKTIKSYIYSIFYNIIHNSIKYRRPGIPIIIELKSEKKDDSVILRFIDNGLGIDLERQKDQVFGLYKRFHHHTDGKGMGLFMVKTQVEILGGKIEVKSEVGKGSEFIISLGNPEI